MTDHDDFIRSLAPDPNDDEETAQIKAEVLKDLLENPITDADIKRHLKEWTPEQYEAARGQAYIAARLPKAK